MLSVGMYEQVIENFFQKDYFCKNFIIDSICEFSSDAIVVLDFNKNIISYSKEFQNLFAGENLLGMNFFNLINRIVQLPNDFFNQTSYFLRVLNSDEERVLHSQISFFKNKENFVDRYVVILKDVTEKKELEAQRDNFIATLTHDLKTPVRADIMSLELLLKGKFGCLSVQQQEIIEEILNSNKFMMAMLDTLLTKYKYESGLVELNKTLFDLNEMVEESAKSLKCLFNEKNISLKFKLYSQKIMIYADRLELKRAISNLLTNAIKFNKANGEVIVSTKIKDNFAYIFVKDTGIGISPEKLTHIFDKYVSYAKRYRQLGTGLGLYVAKKIVELHNGKINVNSTVKKGSVFSIKIPVSEGNSN